MQRSRPLRASVLTLTRLAAFYATAQPRAAACFYSADFETIDQFSGWDIGDFVLTQTPDGDTLGGLVPAWETSTAELANADGYFPVPDQPVGNRFVAVNDAAAPCNCTMNDVALVTPAFDLSGRSGVALECRVFNEGTLGAGTATIEANFGGGSWIALATIPTLTGEWQPLFIDLSAFDGQAAVRLRFRWSDGGTWSSGFALDDFCLRERLPFDVSITSASIGDATVSAFSTGPRSLFYSALPLEQAAPFQVSMTLRNRGTQVVDVTGVTVDVSLNGQPRTQATQLPIGILPSGRDTLVVVEVDWAPDEVGELALACAVGTSTPDNDISDNSITLTQRITGAGWDNGYGAMACDNGVQHGAIGNSENFIAANRMEIVNPGSHARGVSAELGIGTQVGETIRVILMDANFAFVDTSTRRVITQEDMDMIWNGGALYLPLNATPELFAGDYFAGLQHLDTGTGNPVQVAVGGDAEFGRSVIMEGSGFVVQYLRSTPMVRLHLEELGVGIEGPADKVSRSLGAYPTPATSTVQLTVDRSTTERVQAQLLDASGRMVRSWSLGVLQQGTHTLSFSVEDLAAGSYTAVLSSMTGQCRGRIQVVH